MDTELNPSSKHAANGGPSAFATTRNYRHQPTRRRHSGQCCFSCCLWTTTVILVILLLSIVAGVIFYVLYSPHRPVFTVTSLNLRYLNATSSTVSSNLTLIVTAKNPNKKLVYVYSLSSIIVLTNGVNIGDGTFPAFVHRTGNTTVLRSTVARESQTVEREEVDKVTSALKTKGGVPMKVRVETKVVVKVGVVKTPRIGIRVTCDGNSVIVPEKATCKVQTRIKIWRWTV